MNIVQPMVEIVGNRDYGDMIKLIESAGRTCYKSENLMSEESAEKFVQGIIKRGHESVLEHASVSVRFTVDRGVSHEIVRHRIAAYSQESTRYCNYAKEKFGIEITVIHPCFWDSDSEQYRIWKESCLAAEKAYFELLHSGASPEQARSVLPNSLKTELVMTADVREWRHFFKLRCSPAAHPQMRQVALLALDIFKENYPALFGDIEVEAF